MLLTHLLLPALAAAQTVTIANGTITGKFIQSYNQDAYLGIPYAAVPTGSLRFANPQVYNGSWNYTKEFTEFGDACIASGGTDNKGLPQSEDCLTLNVVKPHGDCSDLPVAIWIHGGGFQDGTSRRDPYNLSFIIQNSVEVGMPFIGVSINYRLDGFGFLESRDTEIRGWSNVGLRDQLKAIEWVHENIAAFGGNPGHIVIWGESAGAISAGLLLNSGYLGDYVKGAIMQSGAGMSPNIGLKGVGVEVDELYETLTDHFNCTDAIDSLSCLQNVDANDLQYAFNATNKILPGTGFRYPYFDGDVIPRSGYLTAKNGFAHKAALLVGTNTDEGISFTAPGQNTTELMFAGLRSKFVNLKNATLEHLNDLYPLGDSLVESPLDPTYNKTPVVIPSSYGEHYRRAATIATDLYYAVPVRLSAQFFAEQGLPVYKYRFNIPDKQDEDNPKAGSQHFQEVVYVFDNNQAPEDITKGSTWNPNPNSPKIADEMSKNWAAFIHNFNPNFNGASGEWPQYGETGQNRVFDLNGLYNEDDDWREEQYAYIESVWNQLY